MRKINVCTHCGKYDAPGSPGTWKNWDRICRMRMVEIDESLCIIKNGRVVFMDNNTDAVKAERARRDRH